MKVILARHAGACYGVQRALDMALAAASAGDGASTLGPLIHNPQVVADLERRGVRAVGGVEEAGDNPVIIRSHGVTPAVRRAVEERGLPLIDATCPHVARAQKAAAELARRCGRVVVVGEAGHPEVEGLVAHAREAGGEVCVAALAKRPSRASGFPNGRCRANHPDARGARRREGGAFRARRGMRGEGHRVLCHPPAPGGRRRACGKVDAIVVIGGRNSSNTTRLADICAAACPRTHHVEAPTRWIPPGLRAARRWRDRRRLDSRVADSRRGGAPGGAVSAPGAPKLAKASRLGLACLAGYYSSAYISSTACSSFPGKAFTSIPCSCRRP